MDDSLRSLEYALPSTVASFVFLPATATRVPHTTYVAFERPSSLKEDPELQMGVVAIHQHNVHFCQNSSVLVSHLCVSVV